MALQECWVVVEEQLLPPVAAQEVRPLVVAVVVSPLFVSLALARQAETEPVLPAS